MRLVKIGLGNVNATVGAITANLERCLAMARAMAAANGYSVTAAHRHALG